MLVNFFVNRFNRKLGRSVETISSKTLSALEAHRWPGNVRELANVVERAMISSNGIILELADKLDTDKPESSTNGSERTLTRLEDVERDHIITILNSCKWRIEGEQGAAQVLGINSSTLRSRMLKLGINRPREIITGVGHG
jgi:DNA-binding NtrC family response regulator